MLLNKKIILYPEKTEKNLLPIVCLIKREGSSTLAFLNASCDRLTVANASNSFDCRKKDGGFVIESSMGEDFAICAYVGDKKYSYGNNSFFQNKKTLSEQKKVETRADELHFLDVDKVNVPYNDEAISTENYYPEKYGIKAAFAEFMCEKGGIYISEDEKSSQNLTIYPQKEVGGKNEGVVYEKNECAMPEKNQDEKKERIENAYIEKESSYGSLGTNGGQSRVYALKEKAEAVLASFPREKNLERVMDGCRFAKITYAEKKYYVAGISEKDGKPEYLFFGVPVKYGESAPEEFLGKAYFVPVFFFKSNTFYDGENSLEWKIGENAQEENQVTKEIFPFGYYLLCQDIYTGKIT